MALNMWNSTPIGHWSALPSSQLRLNSTHGQLFAVAPHFSYFAVFGAPAQGGAGTVVIIVVAAVALAVIAGSAVLLRSRGTTGRRHRQP